MLIKEQQQIITTSDNIYSVYLFIVLLLVVFT